ncbi:aminoglycoside N(3)-acetyltransferase [Haloplasma contractile]|uniref:Aminoglycoside N(3)-acetyltransferase n=1 Tax=Haloplasma contractile SSD-17B TaxID=1033810 RepID=U2E7K8_9MOLU|nr:AAC(3) family N-acetyltransferase [Haloplasma contractile]ERJ10891.1 Aminoglycoside N3-acetyltransferase protein [Haloplasma contractile SSD-17B]
MPVQEAILKVSQPITKVSIKNQLTNLGIVKGDHVIVHTSLKSIGYVVGNHPTVIKALIEQVSETGTIVMPAHSGDNSNPDNWQNPPVPREWCAILKDEIPAYDPSITPTYHIGVIPESFRTYPGVVRSNHPQFSFSAWGQNKYEVIEPHKNHYGLGINSPLGRLYKMNAKILMIGTDYETCTALHLAEYMADIRKKVFLESAVNQDGERKWIQFEDIDLDTEHFNDIGLQFEQKHSVQKGVIGAADTIVVNMASLIDYAVEYYKSQK